MLKNFLEIPQVSLILLYNQIQLVPFSIVVYNNNIKDDGWLFLKANNGSVMWVFILT